MHLDNYAAIEQWLFQKLPMYQRVGSIAYKANLNNIIKFCSHLENPQDRFKTIHVAGTNGKGSTSHMIASVLQEASYKVGLHTSPHLKHFGERSRINGISMPEDFIIEFVTKHKEFIEDLGASFFEVAVALGFQYFAKEEVDIAVIETGLGGRLDATNIITPEIAIITNIGLDHTHILGDNIKDIAYEKAGIIKPNIPIVIGEYTEETKQVFTDIAKTRNSEIFFAQDILLPTYTTDLKGNYQRKNVKTATLVLQILRDKGWELSILDIKSGLQKVVENTQLKGRWDILQEKPLVVADTAHNMAGIEYIVQQISEESYDNLHLVLGFVNDKDALSIIEKFPNKASYYFCAPNIPRKLELEALKKIIPKGLNASFYSSVTEALDAAKDNASKKDFIYVGGSTFVVAEIV